MNTPHIDQSLLRRLLDQKAPVGGQALAREAYLSEEVFELEMARIFEGTWLFVGLTSELPNPHDYITRRMGRQPVVLMRDGDGNLGGFLNSCRHRGTLLCPRSAGNSKFHVCPYHGWAYDSAGRNRQVTDQDDGQYPEGFITADKNLVPVARVATYRDFIFASLAPDVPPLADHLGEARVLLDLIADQAPEGLEFVPGPVSYTFDGNWKLQFENGLDGYHFATTHAAFVDILRQRPPAELPDYLGEFVGRQGEVASGTVGLPQGHAMSWSLGAPGQGPESRPFPRDKERFAAALEALGPERLSWMLRQRNLTIFPNAQLIDIQSLQLRVWEPLSAGRTRMVSHCLAPIGENAEARRVRIRQYEEFFNASGLATSDDNVMYELSQDGLAATAAGPTLPFARGAKAPPAPAEPYAALNLDQARLTYSTAGLTFGDESGIHPGYREWLRLMLAGN